MEEDEHGEEYTQRGATGLHEKEYTQRRVTHEEKSRIPYKMVNVTRLVTRLPRHIIKHTNL